MKTWKNLVVGIIATVLAVSAVVLFWQHNQTRQTALHSLSRLASALADSHNSDLLDFVLMPVAVRSQTPAEQHEFVAKALSDEISSEGILALKHHAEFGLAKSVFPDEYANWCQQADVNADDCVAFKMERGGIRAEVLLVHDGQTYRVVRCNNVKQMAEGI